MGGGDVCKGTSDINHIPENLLLEIFRYLPVKDRCISGRVCRQWRRIVNDNSLWRHVDLLEYRLDLPKMWKVLRAHFSPCLLTIRIRGFAHAGSSKRKKASVSDAMLKELSVRCPNLWLLHLHDCNTDNLTFDSLPSTITSLYITNSSWQPRWLRDNQKHLPHLDHLSLSWSVRVDNFDLEDIAQWTGLKKLSLSGCYRIKGSAVEVLAKSIQNLESLNLSGAGIDELAIHHIARHLKNLKELFLANCSAVNDSSLATISSGLSKLNVLDISDCESVTVKGLRCLFAISSLQFLTLVRKTKLTTEELDSVKCGFPHRIVITT